MLRGCAADGRAESVGDGSGWRVWIHDVGAVFVFGAEGFLHGILAAAVSGVDSDSGGGIVQLVVSAELEMAVER